MTGFWSRLFGGDPEPQAAPAIAPTSPASSPVSPAGEDLSPEERAAQDLAVARNIALLEAETFTVRLSKPELYEEAIARCWPGEDVTIVGNDEDSSWMMARTEAGEDLGTLPTRGKLASALKAGDRMIGAAIRS